MLKHNTNKKSLYASAIKIFTASALLLSIIMLSAACVRETAYPEPAEITDTADLSDTESSGKESSVTDPAINESMPALTEENLKQYPQRTNVPTLYIETEIDYKRIRKDEYINGIYTLVSDGTGIVGQPLKIKGRGNYSWSFPQKPYTLRLESGESLLGMDKGKKWVLITTYSDKTLLRNYLTLNMSARLIGMRYAVEAEYVDVYLDGEYNGLYALSEKITLGKNRADADALFEIEAQYRHNDCSNCIICSSGCHLMFKESRSADEDTAEWSSQLKEYAELIKNADKAMNKGPDEYLKYIDIDSFIDWYIINELVKNYDSGFTTSCYFCVKDGILYMGPCWDYDTCMGNQVVAECVKPVGYHVANSPWYAMLLSDEYFVTKLYTRWTQLWNDGIFETFLSMIDETSSIIADSEKLDHKKYPTALTNHDLRGDLSRETWEEELDYLKNWVNTRLEWLNSEWNEAYDHEDSSLMLITGTGARYADSGTRKLFESLNDLTASSGVSRITGTVDGYGDESVDKAFDGNYATKYCWPCNGESEIQFRTGEAISPTHYALMTANDTSTYTHRNPQKWKIYGSNDLNSWELLTEVNDGRSMLASADFTWHVFKLDNPGSYRYYKIVISNDDIVQFSEIALLG